MHWSSAIIYQDTRKLNELSFICDQSLLHNNLWLNMAALSANIKLFIQLFGAAFQSETCKVLLLQSSVGSSLIITSCLTLIDALGLLCNQPRSKFGG